MRARLGILVLALASACGYSEFDNSTTLFKCDLENPCPADHFCSDSPSGVCILNGTRGCRNQELSRHWGFDSAPSIDGWFFNLDDGAGPTEITGPTGIEIKWTPTEGNPVLGAFELQLFGDVTVPQRLGWFRNYDEFGDLRGKIMSVRAWADKPAQMTVYVQNSDTGAGWADGGLQNLLVNEWDCVDLNLDEPDFNLMGYDPSTIQGMGIELWGVSPMRVIIDDAGY